MQSMVDAGSETEVKVESNVQKERRMCLEVLKQGVVN